MEIWKSIEGFEGLYEISNLGRVKRLVGIKCKKERFLKPRVSTTGYLFYGLYKNSLGKNAKIHRLIAVHFIPNPLGLREVNHKNGIKTDNKIENLEWVTHQGNSSHAIKLGLTRSISGSNHFGSKLTEAKVLEIREKYPLRTTNCIKFSAQYGIKKSCLMSVISRRNWSHI